MDSKFYIDMMILDEEIEKVTSLNMDPDNAIPFEVLLNAIQDENKSNIQK